MSEARGVRRAAIGLVAAGVALHLALALPTLWTTVDDAWITARYALHLAEGFGPVYNAGEWIEGYSDPAWMLLLSAALALGLDPYPVMVFAGLLFGALVPPAAAWLTTTLAGRFDLRAGVAALVAGASIHLAVVATNGLETSQWVLGLVVACAATLATTTGRGALLAGLAVGALAWIRPEGSFLSLVFGAFVAWTRRPLLGRWLLGAAPPVLLVHGLRAALYGTLLANPVSAKVVPEWDKILAKNLTYLGRDGAVWPVVALLALVSLALPGDRRARLLPVALGFVLLTGMLRIEEWMPGARLMVPLWVLTAAAVASADLPRRALLVPPALALGVLLSPIRASAVSYDERNSVLPGNPASIAAARLAAQAPGATLAVRDAGVVAYWVGTSIRVIETHPRALTLPHPDGAPTLPPSQPPDLLVTTVQRDDADESPYPPDKALLRKREWKFLGRASQHYRRAYDFWARPGLDVDELPAELRLR